MTEYGRSPGSEPWHPGDPLYGDQGWEGQQQYPHPQQASQYDHQAQGYVDPYGQGGHADQGYGGDPYQQQAQQYQQQPQQYVDPQYQQQHQQYQQAGSIARQQ
ncbi:endolytic transglycosylase MltG [Streptomyces tanashiensis]